MNMTFAMPVPENTRVSQEFGANPKMYAKFGLAGHNGRDYALVIGTPVMASINGTIAVPAFAKASFGHYILLETHEWRVLYAHLSKILVATGDVVTPGQVIALSGNTGNSTGPHLHYGVKPKFASNPAYNNYIDPRLVL